MNPMSPEFNDRPVAVTGPGALRLERYLPGPIERVWRYLTEPGLRAQWLAGGPMDLHPGGAVDLVFHNDALTPGDDAAPAQYAQFGGEIRLAGRITACEPPRLLAFTWGEGSPTPSEVSIELSAREDGVLLVLTHVRLSGPSGMVSVSTGWHTHIGLLIARLGEAQAPGFWRTFAKLEPGYAARVA